DDLHRLGGISLRQHGARRGQGSDERHRRELQCAIHDLLLCYGLASGSAAEPAAAGPVGTPCAARPPDTLQLHHSLDSPSSRNPPGEKAMPLPLEGVKVLDLTSIMAGPYCTMVLGDLGAEVIKVESFPEGDGSRRFDPKVNGESYCFAVLNRNKKSLALNVKDPRGKALFMKLAAQADVITENFRPGVARRLGIDYEAVSRINPAVVYASMSGF